MTPNLPTLSLRTAPPAESCDIIVKPGLISTAGFELRRRSKAPKVLIVTDSTVGPLHAQKLIDSLARADFHVTLHTLPAGEEHKQLETLLPAYATFLAANIDRQTPLIALGGGVTGDMAGLLAATLLRGVPLVQVPTTLMAMVDSSIGGKTAVNHPAGKNLIGVFHQPLLVLSDPELLLTLPDAELSNGLAECIKHDAIRDAAHFARLTNILPRARQKDIPTLAALIHHNASIKTSVVTEDPLERGVRAHLNLGHTFAHAIELVTHHGVSHGAAVGLGLCAAATLSHDLGLLAKPAVAQIVETVALAGLPTRGLTADVSEMIAAMRRDKKVEHGHLRFVLLSALGNPLVRPDIPESAVRAAFDSIR